MLYSLFCVLSLSACGGKSKALPSNKTPTVNAGVDQVVVENTQVILSGFGGDSDGVITSYSWEQVSGDSVSISSSSDENSSFVAPDTNSELTLTFRLSVTDDFGAMSIDDIDILVKPIAPSQLDYGSEVTFKVFHNVKLIPEYEGYVSFFSLVGDLPQGLSFDSLTGKISGVPTEAINNIELQVTANNDGGNITTTFSLSFSGVDIDELLQELITNKAKWGSQNISSYQFERIINCHFCSYPSNVLFRIQVKDGNTNFVFTADRNIALSTDSGNSFSTVDELFDSALNTINSAAIYEGTIISIHYDHQYGYPTHISSDNIYTEDDGFLISSSKLVVFDDLNCDEVTNLNPSVKLNVLDSRSMLPINCKVKGTWKIEGGELQDFSNEDIQYIESINVFGYVETESVSCDDEAPILIFSSTDLIFSSTENLTITVNKESYSSKEMSDIAVTTQACGLIPMELEVILNLAN